MNRYGTDFNRGSSNRYGRDYQRWNSMPRYDRDFGYQSRPMGRSYDRDLSTQEPRNFGYRSTGRYDQGFANRYDRGFTNRYDRSFTNRYDQGYMSRQRGYNQPDRFNRDTPSEIDWHEAIVTRERSYPNPWNESHPAAYRFGLGFGQGRGQFIYK